MISGEPKAVPFQVSRHVGSDVLPASEMLPALV